ncbi:MAG: dihydrolipoamide succinyltransferase [Gammaproteobacteria bacterium]|nr:MAG: dihydrolipoamide succinyltransferase [Gammaproteobacteria bacterium]RLA22446.1 MAG: dihydrolipoamide succinyltransferase [Gammaproteobacteria bacterium]
MSIEVLVPSLPESVADATIVTWHKQVGDVISKDDNLVDLETDKVVLEVPATENGILKEIIEQDGAIVTGGQLLAVIEVSAAGASTSSPQPVAAAQSASEASAPLSPAVRKLIAEKNLDPSQIAATGKGGRLTKADVVKFLENPASAPAPMATPAPAQAKPAPVVNKSSSPTPATPITGNREEQRVPMTRLRAKVAERLIQAQQTAAMLTTFNEVNMQPVMDLRNKYKEQFLKAHDTKLGFMSFFVKASIEALKRFPIVNASVDGNDIVYHGYYDIGIAVSSPRGLVVPVMRDADMVNFAGVESKIVEFGGKARDGALGLDDLTGGTFTITNGGIFGSMMSTPILNPPQSAILGMHSIKERAMVENGQIVIRPMMYLALSYDHRIIDGKDAVQFLVTIKDCLEDPARLLLNV